MSMSESVMFSDLLHPLPMPLDNPESLFWFKTWELGLIQQVCLGWNCLGNWFLPQSGRAQSKIETIIGTVCFIQPTRVTGNAGKTVSNEKLKNNLQTQRFFFPHRIWLDTGKEDTYLINLIWEMTHLHRGSDIDQREEMCGSGNAQPVWSLCESWPWLMMAGGGGVSWGKKPRLY